MKNRYVLIFLLSCLTFYPCAVKAASSSTHYEINADSINFMGEDSSSAHYNLNDTGGEVATGDSTSAHYQNRAGYWAMVMDYHISISSPLDLAMSAIAGIGQSTVTNNYRTWTVITDNAAGYSLYWRADQANMLNANSDAMLAYTPVTPNVPEAWSVAAATSEWGGHLGSTSTTVNTTTWGSADTYAGGKWLNVATSDYNIATRVDETSVGGDNETIYFGAEVGANKHQPSGTYSVNVTVTAVTL